MYIYTMIIKDITVDGTLVSKLTHGSEKLITVQCETCSEIRNVIYHNYTERLEQNKGKTLCKKCACKLTGLKSRGRPGWNKGMKFPERSGKKSVSWRGGTYRSSDGYKMVYVGSRKDKIGWNSYRKEHTVKIEKKLKRKLLKTESIHHINGDRLDNRLNNLFVTDNSGHRNAHASLQKIGYLLIQTGQVKFNRKTGFYVAHDKLRKLLEQLEAANQQPSS
jgi:hypothetical protein